MVIALKICNYRTNYNFNAFRNQKRLDSGDMFDTKNQSVLDTRVKDFRDPRKYSRIDYFGPVIFRYGGQKFKKGAIINISRSGIFIETKNKGFHGQAIELVIPNKKMGRRLRVKGWIVRLSQTGIGVAFKGTLDRRSGKERRSDLDRRSGSDRRNSRKPKAEVEKHKNYFYAKR